MQSYKDAYLVYARKSTDDQENQKNSLPYQVDAGTRYARDNALKVAKVTLAGFSHDGVIQEKHSGYTTSELRLSDEGQVTYDIERPKFQRMAQMLLRREFKGVICLCWDRISRNEQDGLLIKKMMDSAVDVRFVQVTYDKTSSGALHRDIDGMFSQHYSRVISEKVRNTFEKFRREGRCLGPAPIGYLDHGSDSKPFDPVRAPIVKRLFELYATGGWSFSQLAHWANQQGLTTKPTRGRRSREKMHSDENGADRPQLPGPVTPKTMESILRNSFYIGHHTDLFGNSRRCKHAPLIDTKVFLAVRQSLATRNVGIHPIVKDFFAYRALIRCSQCGRLFSPYVQKGITYYRCRCVPGCKNTTVNLNAHDIDTAIADKLDQLCFTDAELAVIEAGAAEGLDKIARKRKREVADLDLQRDRVFADLDYLKKNKIFLLRTGATTAEDYALDVARLELELDDIFEKMNAYKEAETDMLKFVLSFSEMVKAAGEHYRFALDSERRARVTLVFSELKFGDGAFELKVEEAFSQVFLRARETKNTQGDLSMSSGSGIDWFSELPNLFTVAERLAGPIEIALKNSIVGERC